MLASLAFHSRDSRPRLRLGAVVETHADIQKQNTSDPHLMLASLAFHSRDCRPGLRLGVGGRSARFDKRKQDTFWYPHKRDPRLMLASLAFHSRDSRPRLRLGAVVETHADIQKQNTSDPHLMLASLAFHSRDCRPRLRLGVGGRSARFDKQKTNDIQSFVFCWLE